VVETDEVLEEGDRFDGSSGSRQLLGDAPIRRWRLARHAEDERGSERHAHTRLVVAGSPAITPAGYKKLTSTGYAFDGSYRRRRGDAIDWSRNAVTSLRSPAVG
jgi:hypothetical protein